MAAHSGWRAEAEPNAGRRVADQEAAAAARAATPEGQAARIASGILRHVGPACRWRSDRWRPESRPL